MPAIPLLSLKNAAIELGYSGGLSVLDFIATVDAGAEGPFTPLAPRTDGGGQWRADRYRIYFFADRGVPIEMAQDFDHFERLFPQIFDGEGEDIDRVEQLRRNVGTNFFHPSRPFKGRHSLQFFGSAKVFFQLIDATGLHDDWVGIIHSQNNSFAVQTMKRNFALDHDVDLAVRVIAFLKAIGQTLSTIFDLPLLDTDDDSLDFTVVNVGGGVIATWINRYHFLAGFRSWKLGKLPPIEPSFAPGSEFNIYYLETAAIDRYSSWFIELADLLDDFAMGSIDDLTREVWTTLAHNWGRYGVEELGYNLDVSAWEDEIAQVEGPGFNLRDGNVRINQASFDTEAEMMSQDWVAKLLADHPGIKAQF